MADFRPEEEVPAVTSPEAVPEPIAAFIEEAREEARDDAPPQALLEHPAPPVSVRQGRILMWIAAGFLGLAVGAALMMLSGRNRGQDWAATTPNPQNPAKVLLREAEVPSPPMSATSGVTTPDGFEIGVAVFSGPTRAGRLEAELAAAGFKATTHSIELAGAPMFEVRVGPYATREAADTEVARVRQMPGYADARVISRTPVAQ
jgi:hypothetical protein